MASNLLPDEIAGEKTGVDAIFSKEEDAPATWDVPVMVLLLVLLFLLVPFFPFLFFRAAFDIWCVLVFSFFVFS